MADWQTGRRLNGQMVTGRLNYIGRCIRTNISAHGRGHTKQISAHFAGLKIENFLPRSSSSFLLILAIKFDFFLFCCENKSQSRIRCCCCCYRAFRTQKRAGNTRVDARFMFFVVDFTVCGGWASDEILLLLPL